jgi:hypothetical protein
MKKLLQTISLIGLSAALGANPALARDWVLLDAAKAPQNWQITSQELCLKIDKPFSVGLRILHGGRQESNSIRHARSTVRLGRLRCFSVS